MKILVTGATGFIGRGLCAFLLARGDEVRAAVRRDAGAVAGVEYVPVGAIHGATDWAKALEGIDIVIHLAARVHVMHDTAGDPLEAFRQVNVQGTERLAQMAVKAGVKRFVFVSSVKVNGEGAGHSYTEEDVPKPEDAYAISKHEAEARLAGIAGTTGLKLVIVRLPLVYGAGVKANFRSLIKLAGSGIPLPFKAMHNHRSLIYVGNAVDAIITCAMHPQAVGETFLVSDGEDVSTPQLLTMIAKAMGRQVRLFPVPMGLLKGLCQMLGKGQEFEKLTGDLVIDSRKIRTVLGWNPPFTMAEGIAATVDSVKSFMKNVHKKGF